MSSNLLLRTPSKPTETGVPYASYAQIVRMLLPLTGKVSFYDERGKALWISDGLEEPELRVHVEGVLSRCTAEAPGAAPCGYLAGGQGQPTYVFPIRDSSGTLVGAMAIVFRDVPANATYRRLETVERLLAPLLDILAYGWNRRVAAEVPVLQPETDPPLPAGVAASLASPALLRRTLALATHRLQCAFGAFVMLDEPFTLTHRASPDESDVTMNAAIEAVREPMSKLMQVRSGALIVNRASGRNQAAPYKLLVLPVRSTSSGLAALMLLFRSKHEPDFTGGDVDELLQVVARLSPPVLTDVASEPAAALIPPQTRV